MNHSKIETCRLTWNPITGCDGPDNGKRCSYCYANHQAQGRLKTLYLSNPDVRPDGDPLDPYAIRFWASRTHEPNHLRRPSLIFAVNMGDLFGDTVPILWRTSVHQTVTMAQQHDFQVLTKFPHNLKRWSPFQENIWAGVSATDRHMAMAAIHHLEQIEAPVKFISFEPLLGDIGDLDLSCLDWAIIGAQTGANPQQTDPLWVGKLIDRCKGYGVKVFVKDNLKWPNRHKEWPTGFNIDLL